MPRVAIEYVILIPLLLLQITVFPLAASTMTSSWTNERRQVALQEAANHLGSTIQQLYVSLNQKEISSGTIIQASTLPPMIELYPYTAVGELGPPLDPDDPDSARVLLLTLTLQQAGNTATAYVTLGPNVSWEGGTFQSNSPTAAIKAEKDPDGTLHFSFMG